MCCTDWCVICASSRKREDRERGRGWGGDTQIYCNTAWIFHLPAAVFITFSQGSHCGFCNARESLHVKHCSHGNLKERKEQKRWGRWPWWQVSCMGTNVLVSWAFGYIWEDNERVCWAEWMFLAGFPQRESGKRPDAYPWRNCPTLCANLGPAAGAWWERKISLPPFFLPSEKYPDLNTDSDE